jgi:hypothetical protein
MPSQTTENSKMTIGQNLKQRTRYNTGSLFMKKSPIHDSINQITKYLVPPHHPSSPFYEELCNFGKNCPNH